ncbi:carbohydrate ABC transporter substrate-binding protein [Microbacterium esteraromaticum]|uniref:Carbohydrate ABC transporter substrate-binding protein n=1 Tax=Microbacterium esteraromaticum TaxID=57043 RepID=A0A939DUI8_9MICO|nr:ABC transporter substrate-binding protein [Microbacterium esteraromaticum]MBN8205257.1 carbohydrate ABC transporter substrate-binding protein [Microbacterium esteraromaticum]MBN8415411.1 carbohydrate ABC transporter substrate-binding protein [Microbacterium esteraromaticum]
MSEVSKKALAGPAVLIIAALALTGCSGPGDDGEVTLELQSAMAEDSPRFQSLSALAAAYEDENPGVTIDVVPLAQDYEGDMKVRMASGDLPDIWATHGWSLLRYSEFLEPLQERAWAENLNPVLDATMRNDAGEFFALPLTTDVAGILYNQTVLDDHGIDPASLGTIDAFDDALEKLAEAGIVPLSASGKDSWFAGNVADWLASGSFDEGESDRLAGGEFVDSGFEAMYSTLADWADEGYFNPDFSAATSDDIATALGQGTTAFVMIQNSLALSARQFVPEAELGFLPVPAINGDPEYLIGGEGVALGAWRDGEHKQQALDFLDFLAETENIGAFAGEDGNPAGLTGVDVDLGELSDSYEQFFAPGDVRMVPYFDRAYLPNGMWNTLITTTSGVVTGQASVDDAVAQVEADFGTLFGQQ